MDQKKKSTYEIETWNVSDLIDSLEGASVKGKKVSVPKFQRNLVWSEKQKLEFIRSVKDGFPFGALLLALDKVNEDQKSFEYKLLDGLQRSSTIRDHIKDPNKSFDRSEIEESLIIEICKLLGLEFDATIKEILEDTLSKWIKSKKGFSEKDGFSSFELAKEIIALEKTDDYQKTIEGLVGNLVPFLEKVKKDADISETKIPIILYNGPPHNLPTIFENLNSKGSKLTKYQIYAATWQNIPVDIDDNEIIELIQNKYQALVDEGYHVDNYDEDSFKNGPFNLFEYIFGLGKLITIKYPYLFGESDDETADSIGFNLSAICLSLKINEMDKLPEKIKKVDLTTFQNAVFSSTEFVYSALSSYITLRANRRKQKKSTKPRIYHTEYQVISLIGKVFQLQYDNKYSKRKEWKNASTILQKTIPQHYLFDILRDVWRGSGDTRIVEILDNDDYLNVIPKKRWESILDDWFEDAQLARKETKRVNIKDTDYLFLNYIYAHTLSYENVKSLNEFEIEHLVPVNRLKPIANDGIPISAVSNMCMLPSELNKEKKDLTIYEYYDNQIDSKKTSSKEADAEIKQVEKFSFTTRPDLEFMKKITIDEYKKFLITRFGKLKETFYEKNSIN